MIQRNPDNHLAYPADRPVRRSAVGLSTDVVMPAFSPASAVLSRGSGQALKVGAIVARADPKVGTTDN